MRKIAPLSEPLKVHAVASTDSLDAAWAEAEAALPEGWAIVSIFATSSAPWEWRAFAGLTVNPESDDPFMSWAEGPTPAAALRALAARLRGET